jgi:hypothetical protein
MRRIRSAIVSTYVVSAAAGYTALAFHALSPVLGEWAQMQAVSWIVWVEPWVVLAPPWMVGGTIYNIRSEFVRSHIVTITALAFTAAAILIGMLSYWLVRRERRAYVREGRQG